MSTVLDRILAAKRLEVEAARSRVPLDRLREQAATASAPRGFERSLRARIGAGGVGVIAEIKRASPSKGLIRADFDPGRIAASYEANGAACLSVLTDRDFFGGRPEDLAAANGERNVVDCLHHSRLGEKMRSQPVHLEDGFGDGFGGVDHRCSRGFSTSRNWSATRLMLTIVSSSAMPGKKLIQYLPDSRYW